MLPGLTVVMETGLGCAILDCLTDADMPACSVCHLFFPPFACDCAFLSSVSSPQQLHASSSDISIIPFSLLSLLMMSCCLHCHLVLLFWTCAQFLGWEIPLHCCSHLQCVSVAEHLFTPLLPACYLPRTGGKPAWRGRLANFGRTHVWKLCILPLSHRYGGITCCCFIFLLPT